MKDRLQLGVWFIVAFLSIGLLLLLLLKGCHHTPQPTLAQKKSDSTKIVIQELTRDNIIYRDRWHSGKTKYIHTIDSIIAYSIDTCIESVIEVKKVCEAQQKQADSLIYSDSLIITSQASFINFNNPLIDSLHNKILSLRHDTIPKQRRKGFYKGFKWGFGIGVIGGAATNLIK